MFIYYELSFVADWTSFSDVVLYAWRGGCGV